jgi:hypothetical protein
MEKSALGMALKKIGLKIGVDTGLNLSKYIKKKSDLLREKVTGNIQSCDDPNQDDALNESIENKEDKK